MSGLLYGLDKELAQREADKRDTVLEGKVRTYLEGVTGESVGEDLLESLKDGTILCMAMNVVAPGSIAKIHQSKMPFKQMENIANFLKACRQVLNMHESDLFTTADLYDGKSVVNLTSGLVAFSRAAAKHGYTKTPSIAPKESVVRRSLKKWSINPNSTLSKMTQGSSRTMEKSGVQRQGPTFGADHTQTMWGNTEVSKLSLGSSRVMDRPDISRANDITFGHDAGNRTSKRS